MSQQQQQQQKGDHVDVTLRALTHSASQGARLGATLLRAVSTAPLLPYFLIRVAVNLVACWGTPFVRQRLGRHTIFASCIYAFFLLVGLIPAFPDGQPRVLAEIWVQALVLALICRGFGALRRVLWPKPGERHVHRWSAGELSGTLQALRGALGPWAPSPAVVEVAAFLILSLVVTVLGGIVDITGKANAEAVWILPVLVASALVAQRLILAAQDKFRLAMILDQEVEQRGLADALASRGDADESREAEGFAAPAGRMA